MTKAVLQFNGLKAEILKIDLEKSILEVDFNGELLVQFTKQENGDFVPTNAMNGYGENCYDEIKNKILIIVYK